MSKTDPTVINAKFEDQNESKEVESERKLIGTDYTYKHEVVWLNVFAQLFIHLVILRWLYLWIKEGTRWKLLIWQICILLFTGHGITIGAHRLFTHRSFKATPPLRALLILAQTMAGQNPMFVWCRDHRLHHHYSDTDADPHNAKRGFFFSHMGWLMTKKHPYVIELGRKIDLTDLKDDWMIKFQKELFLLPVSSIFWNIPFLPVWIPVQYFGESLLYSVYSSTTRYVISLHFTWLVNSAAHSYGTRPYDRNLQAVESWFVSLVSAGEGWHNYHHAFPWDYKTSELGMRFNSSAAIIRFFEKIGMAYDLKSASNEMIKNKIKRTGDGTHHEFGNEKARKKVKAIGIVHPMNPSYTVTYNDPESKLTTQGLPLFHNKETLNEKLSPQDKKLS